MKTRQIRYFGILILLLISAVSVFAKNTLSVVRSATNTLEIQLSNTDDIYGVQFSLRTSSDIGLCQFERGTRTNEAHWMIAAYKPCDSIVNVVIISVQSGKFSQGQGALGKISFIADNPKDISTASFANVLVTNSTADSIGIAINNITWNCNSNLIASNTEETKSFALGNNYPNPFNPSTKINYRLNKAAKVQLSVYDITGREVMRLIDQYQNTGEYNVDWNSKNFNGQRMASGTYFARLTVDNQSTTSKMILAK